MESGMIRVSEYFLYSKYTVSAVAMQQCALIYAHTMHFVSFHYSIKSNSTVF